MMALPKIGGVGRIDPHCDLVGGLFVIEQIGSDFLGADASLLSVANVPIVSVATPAPLSSAISRSGSARPMFRSLQWW